MFLTKILMASGGKFQSFDSRCDRSVTRRNGVTASAMWALRKLWWQFAKDRCISLSRSACTNPESSPSSHTALRHGPYKHKTLIDYRFSACTELASLHLLVQFRDQCSSLHTDCPTISDRHYHKMLFVSFWSSGSPEQQHSNPLYPCLCHHSPHQEAPTSRLEKTWQTMLCMTSADWQLLACAILHELHFCTNCISTRIAFCCQSRSRHT